MGSINWTWLLIGLALGFLVLPRVMGAVAKKG